MFGLDICKLLDFDMYKFFKFIFLYVARQSFPPKY